MKDILQSIVDKTPGGQAIILMGYDGIAVEQYARDDAAADIEAVAMEFSFRFIELRKAAESLELGQLTDVVVKAERGTLVVRCLNEEFFVALFMDPPAQLGKGRWLLRAASSALVAQL